MGRRSIAAALAATLVCWLPGSATGILAAQPTLDQILAAYAGGDYRAVEQALASSSDFQRHRLSDRRRLERWLGPWHPDKARLLIEMIARSVDIAPAYTMFMLPVGQHYLLTRQPTPDSKGDDALEQRWHGIALAVLQTRFFAGEIDRYLEKLQERRQSPSIARVWPGRAELARGIAQEQLCRFVHASARVDRLTADAKWAAATPPAERASAIECVERALQRFETARQRPESRDEARMRAGWALFQLGRTAEAKELFDGVDATADPDLTYWLALFRGRAADVLGLDADAERAYRDALQAFPDAQSAGVGLALVLFRLHRDDEAEEAARAVRLRSGSAKDPWDTYNGGDGRFLTRWVAELRESAR